MAGGRPLGAFGVTPGDKLESTAGVPAFAGTPLTMSEGTNCRVDEEEEMK